ncbi:MAG: hypothetical protein ACTSU5_18865 [Promethearchaeota archaeon]
MDLEVENLGVVEGNSVVRGGSGRRVGGRATGLVGGLLGYEEAISRGLNYKVVQCPKCRGWTSVRSHAKRKVCTRCGRSFTVPDPVGLEAYAPNSLKASVLVRELQSEQFGGLKTRGGGVGTGSGKGAGGWGTARGPDVAKRSSVGPRVDLGAFVECCTMLQEVARVVPEVGMPRMVLVRLVSREMSVPVKEVEGLLRAAEVSGKAVPTRGRMVYVQPALRDGN